MKQNYKLAGQQLKNSRSYIFKFLKIQIPSSNKFLFLGQLAYQSSLHIRVYQFPIHYGIDHLNGLWQK